MSFCVKTIDIENITQHCACVRLFNEQLITQEKTAFIVHSVDLNVELKSNYMYYLLYTLYTATFNELQCTRQRSFQQ